MTQAQPAQAGIDVSGVYLNGQTWTWDQFNAVSPEDQKQILSAVGLDSSTQTQLLDSLQKMEIQQYQDFKNQKSGQGGGKAGGGVLDTLGQIVNPSNWFSSNPGAKIANKVAGDAPIPQADEKNQVFQSSGLSDIVNQIGQQNKVSTALGQNQTAQPVFSAQNLQDYEKSYLEPLYNAMYGAGGQVNSQIGAIEQSMGDVAKITGQTNSPLTNLMKAGVQGLLPLQQQYGKDAMFATAFGPLLSIINNTVGQQAQLGAKEQATGASIQNLLAYAGSDPQVAAYLNAAGLGGLAGTGGTSSLLGSLGVASAASPTPSGTGVTTQLPGTKPGTTTP